MVSRGEDKYVIWPIYFDRSVSRLQGRRVTKKNAVEKPNVEDIEKAAKSLGLNPVLEKETAFPAKHWRQDGRILVDKKNTKGKIIRQIAGKI